MFGNVVMGIELRNFETLLKDAKERHNVRLDSDLAPDTLRKLIQEYLDLIKKEKGEPFPQDPKVQLRLAIRAVFESWNTPRAVTYRRINNIPDDLGTAVNVQTMVFGNTGDESGSGVLFSRDPSNGEKRLFGEYLLNAQGEDVVAGTRTPQPISNDQAKATTAAKTTQDLAGTLEEGMPEIYDELLNYANALETHFKDVQDVEFTIENRELYILQTRSAKRSAFASIKIAVDMENEGIVDKRQALLMIDPLGINHLLHKQIDTKEKAKHKPIGRGLAASPGAAFGHLVFSADKAVRIRKGTDEDLILVTDETRGRVQERLGTVRKNLIVNGKLLLTTLETSPDDIEGMELATGILTARGGMTSHAAIVARERGKPGIVGCADLEIDEDTGTCRIGDVVLNEVKDSITIDGTTGFIYSGQLPTVESEVIRVIRGELDESESDHYKYYKNIMQWVDEVKEIGVRANADTPNDVASALELGAEGIGLCRTEHMFFETERLRNMQNMIIAGSREDKKKYIDELSAYQTQDFKEIFLKMNEKPVTIRLLDAPLHEFLPSYETLLVSFIISNAGRNIDHIIEELNLESLVKDLLKRDSLADLMRQSLITITGVQEQLKKLRKKLTIGNIDELLDSFDSGKYTSEGIDTLRKVLQRLRDLNEINPMLGHRGCRLGITYPEITEMQTRAIFEAAYAVARDNKIKVNVEVMIPLVSDIGEVRHQKAIILDIARQFENSHPGERERVSYKIGTMIELPRAALTSDEIAREMDFFSFGTNDLTQTTFGFSRDDAEFKFLQEFKDKKVIREDPFVSVDQKGVGRLIEISINEGISANPNLKIGICGEHGGDPASIHFFKKVNMDYVSCSPFRVPIARIAAAQASLTEDA
jgi:pyruvate,orthophosphate dikinase